MCVQVVVDLLGERRGEELGALALSDVQAQTQSVTAWEEVLG